MSNRIMDIYYDIYHIIKENKIELFRALDIKGADWVSHLEKQGKHLGAQTVISPGIPHFIKRA